MNKKVTKVKLKQYSNFSALFIAGTYFLIGIAWIYFSDFAVSQIAQNNSELNVFQTYKGFFYVVSTSILLYMLILRFLHSQYRVYMQQIEIIEEKSKLEKRLQKTNLMYQDLFDNMLDSVAHCRMIYENSIPIDYEYISVNKIFESMTGLHNVIGRKISEFIPQYAHENPESIQIFSEVASSGKPRKWEHYLKSFDQWYNFSVYCPKEGEFIVIAANITREKMALQMLQEKEKLLERTNKIAKIGGWSFDVDTLKGEWTDEIIRIHDLPEGEPIDVKKGIEFYAPNSRPIIQQAVEELIHFGKPYDLELEIISAKGINKWVRVAGEPVIVGGKVVSAHGVMQDITDRKIDEIERNRSNTLLDTIVNSTPDAIFIKDKEGKYLLFNRGAAEITGKNPEEVIGKTDEALFTPEGAKKLQDFDQNILQEGIIRSQEECATTLTGKEKIFWATKGPIYNEDGSLLGVFGVSRDITERKQNEIQLLKHQTMFENIAEGIYTVDQNDCCTYMNKAGLKLLGLEENDIIGQFPHTVFHYHPIDGNDAVSDECTIKLAVLNGKTIHIQHRFIRKNGTHFPVHVTVAPVLMEKKQIGSVITFEDITQQEVDQNRILEEKNRFDHMAHHDSLTGLPNRLALLKMLETKTLYKTSASFALMFIDVDGFKDINDSYGHRFGDQILIMFAELLRISMPEDSFVVRTGGDEFVVLASCNNDRELLNRYIQTLMKNLENPFKITDIDVYITVSTGIAFYPIDATNTEELLQNADAAMHNAKQNGKNTYSFFTSEFTDNALSHITIASNLKKALQNRELTLNFQPQIDPNSNEIIGFESLIRWFAISPSVFIPIAEESRLIIDIGNYVLRECFQTAKEWADSNIRFGRIAVNIAARQMMHSDFISTIDKLLDETDSDPRWIELEITERSIISNPEKVILILEELRLKGFHISIDDFGTGYSSLSYLKNLPIDKLKIDISFIRNIMHEYKNQTIVKTIIALAKGLNLEVLAEGVETEEEMEFLRSNGINSIQGYYYYKPITKEACEKLLH